MVTKKNALYHEMDIPKELDEMINQTIERVNEERINERKTVRSKWLKKGLAVAVGLSLVLVPLNVSKSVASFAAELPIVGQLARLLTLRDYGFDEAVAKGQVTIPAIDGLKNETYEEEINKLIETRVNAALEASKERAAEYKQAYLETGGSEEDYAERKIQVAIDYKIFSSNANTLSFLVYSHESLAAVYATYDYYNIDLENNKELTLVDMLGEDYKAIIRNQVTDYIEATKGEIGYFKEALSDEWTFREDMDFYIKESGSVVLVFEKYELAAGAYGRLEVEINGYE